MICGVVNCWQYNVYHVLSLDSMRYCLMQLGPLYTVKSNVSVMFLSPHKVCSFSAPPPPVSTLGMTGTGRLRLFPLIVSFLLHRPMVKRKQ